MIQRLLTAEDFSRERSELPDAGQWAELISGVPVVLDPPDVEHGTTVLNLSKALAGYVQETLNGYACFDLGLLVQRSPDTVMFPAMSYFLRGERFAEADNEYTQTLPSVVAELLPRYRQDEIENRIDRYLNWGVQLLWMIDPQEQVVYVIERGPVARKRLTSSEELSGGTQLNGFRMPVGELFVVPDWAQ